jgi:hypothetical protein
MHAGQEHFPQWQKKTRMNPLTWTHETDEEAQDTGPSLDDDLDSEVDDFIIEEDDCVFMAMVHPVDPHHFVHASSTVSGRLAEVFAKNSKPKGFEDIVPTSLHTYADVFSETAFDTLPKRHKWDCKGNLTNLRRELHLSLAKGNPK